MGHFVLSVASFLVLEALGLALQDAGSASWALAWLEVPVRFGLLQPLAHWVLRHLAIAWWTWPGLLATILLFSLNSLVAVALLAGIVRARRYASGSSRSRSG